MIPEDVRVPPEVHQEAAVAHRCAIAATAAATLLPPLRYSRRRTTATTAAATLFLTPPPPHYCHQCAIAAAALPLPPLPSRYCCHHLHQSDAEVARRITPADRPNGRASDDRQLRGGGGEGCLPLLYDS